MLLIQKFLILIVLSLLANLNAKAQHPDSVAEVQQRLMHKRQAVLNSRTLSNVQKAHHLLELGAWEEAAELVKSVRPSISVQLAQAKLAIFRNEFGQAEILVKKILEQMPEQREALLLQARLQVQAWELSRAMETARQLLKANYKDEEAALMVGRISMLEKDYDKALAWARKVQRWNSKNAAAYLLESDVHFWNQKPELAEKPLIKCLTLDPFNADARFNYGYAIWRRVDATQLDNMADQWELALALNPLHYATHWHWGNGHTHLTYADYAQPEDEEIRQALQLSDSLIADNKVQEALAHARIVQQQYPGSVLPDMLQGSAYYMAFDMDRRQRLDSAQAIFRRILQKKEHYGPAHNALAAVIKQKQLSYLAAYDSLTQQIAQTEITDPVNFARVFPDVNYYPGDEVQKMVWSQLYESIVYFPFLSKQQEVFVIPPLHIDLAIAMGSPYFRQATTFDNRQWMDIRGVGSGAAAIEYVVRGAYLERNVVLHEYVHQFHGRVFTDAENRAVRRLYYNAMQEGRTLDYYSANNEHEYLAQTYPAYFEPVKVHPLNHKSINTTADLKEKDPELYQFLDELVKRQRAYLQGDRQAMAGNWAQVYLNLATRARQAQQYADAEALLDTALQWDAAYQPALIGYAAVKKQERDFKAAQQWLNRAKSIDSTYAPLYIAEAELLEARHQAGSLSQKEAISRQSSLYRKAMELEEDLLMQAYANQQFREFYADYGMIPEAIAITEAYAAEAPTISTYLRDRRDEALAYASWLKGKAFNSPEAEEVLAALVARKPQHYGLRRQYADVLAIGGKYKEAYESLAEAQRILTAAGTPRADYMVSMAAWQLALGNRDAATTLLQPILEGRVKLKEDQYRMVMVLAELGEHAKAREMLENMPQARSLTEVAAVSLARGKLLEAEEKKQQALKAYERALQQAPYEQEIRKDLIRLLGNLGKHKRAAKIREEGQNLPAQLP